MGRGESIGLISVRNELKNGKLNKFNGEVIP